MTRSGDVVVDPAAKKFSAALPENSPESAAQAYDAVPPMIFGKDKSEAERLIFGRTLAGNYDYGARPTDRTTAADTVFRFNHVNETFLLASRTEIDDSN